MTTRLFRDAYEKLIEEDIAYLNGLPRTLERDHILEIVRRSTFFEYEMMNRLHEQDRKIEALHAEIKRLKAGVMERYW